MAIIEWMTLLGVLVVGLCLGGCALGLLGGLGLTLLAFCGYCLPIAAPSYDLLVLQTAWLILISTLEAVHFFDVIEAKFRQLIAKVDHHILFVALFCYCLVFVTGSRKFFHSVQSPSPGNDSLTGRSAPSPLVIVMGIASHMALLVSPLSVSGLLLVVVLGHSSWPTLHFIGSVVGITIGITALSAMLSNRLPLRLAKIYHWFGYCYQDDRFVANEAKNHNSVASIFLIILLLLVESAFFLVQPTLSSCSRLPYLETFFPVRLVLFFVLIMFAMAAMVLLCYRLKPAKILQTSRFKTGIQQFFIFLGLAWLIETLLNTDNVFSLQPSYHTIYLNVDKMFYHLLFYGIVCSCMLLIDIPIIIWLFMPLFLTDHFSILRLPIGLVGLHILSPTQYWLSKMVNAYCNNSVVRIKK